MEKNYCVIKKNVNDGRGEALRAGNNGIYACSQEEAKALVDVHTTIMGIECYMVRLDLLYSKFDTFLRDIVTYYKGTYPEDTITEEEIIKLMYDSTLHHYISENIPFEYREIL